MSDESDISDYDIESDFDDYEPVVTKKAAAPKKASAAASSKRKVVSTVTKAATKKRTAVDDGDSDGSVSPALKKLKKASTAASKLSAKMKDNEGDDHEMDIDDEVEAPKNNGATAGSKKSSTETYQKLTQLEHILKRPDTYIGSVEMTEMKMWIYDSERNCMAYKFINMVPGFYKIFDEILVNAADNKIRDSNMNTIKVTIDRETNTISVYNNGRGIPIEIHEKEKIYVPEMIFGHLLTSSNYDDDEKKVTGGRNGYGAKLCNIFSTQFTLETADKNTKQKYVQKWTNNMSNCSKPKITSNSKEEYTRITFKPDLTKFGMTEMDDDLIGVLKRRVYDIAGSVRDIKVFLNGEQIKIKSFKHYAEMYLQAIQQESDVPMKQPLVHEIVSPRWEVAFAPSNGSFQQVSFVNSIATTSGGTHVSNIADQIATKLIDVIQKKNKTGAKVKPQQLKNQMFLFINCLIENPAFTSQTKEQLTTKASAFGSKCILSEKFLKDVQKTEIVQNVLDFAKAKADIDMKKTDGSGRRTRISNVKLVDANKAGTRRASECTLILTEGDSAASLAMAGIGALDGGRDLFGIFPLRGKLLNVRDATHDQIMKNSEITMIKQILGLQHKKVYESTEGLRYGHLMIMTDQDHDGSHIKGLIINFFETQFPSLLRIPGFLIEFITPIVKVYKGPAKKPTKSLTFFTMPEYHAWKATQTEKGWEHKYYKGLGTSNEEDAKVYFSDLDKHLKSFHVMDGEGRDLIELAFSKKKADERKDWLGRFIPGTFLDHSQEQITYPDFVNKELILFSVADNARSIPSVVDGLKPGQRKILFATFKKNVRTTTIKVAQLAGYVSEQTAYQHGEQSLQSTIVNLAQSFVGSNNINLLDPDGSFGTRLQGGADAASARYIYTALSGFSRKMYKAEDDPLLTYHLDDDNKIEPHHYVPVVPTVLINGAEGIGTGWSTNIPNYNPVDIVENIRRWMNHEELKPMNPWFRGWKGTVEQFGPDKFRFIGTARKLKDDPNDLQVEITELPIKMWTQDFKEQLETILKAEKTPSFIKDYLDYSSPKKVHFIVTFESKKHLDDALATGLAEKFKLSRNINTTNLVAFDAQGRITKYATCEDIVKEFCNIRMEFYLRRKDHMLTELNTKLNKLTNQARFVRMITDKQLVVSGKKKATLMEELKKLNFQQFPKKKDAKAAGETEATVDDPENENDDSASNGYDYLLSMAIWSLTKERVEKLLAEVAKVEAEATQLTKKTPKDLWNEDLDDFLLEWEKALEEDRKNEQEDKPKGRAKQPKAAKGGGRKRVKNEDDDYEAFTSKKTAMKKKEAVPKISAPSAISKLSVAKKEPIEEATTNREPKVASIFTKTTARAAAQKKSIILDDDDDEDLSDALSENTGQSASTAASKPTANEGSRPGTAASNKSSLDPVKSKAPPRRAAAPKKLILDEDSEEDDWDMSDDSLGDVSGMVKGIGGSDAETKARPILAKSKVQTKLAAAKAEPENKKRLISAFDNEDEKERNEDTAKISALPVITKKAGPQKELATTKKAATAVVKKAAPLKNKAKAAKAKAKMIASSDDDDDGENMDVDQMVADLLDSDIEVISAPRSKAVASKPAGKSAVKAATKPRAKARAAPMKKRSESHDEDGADVPAQPAATTRPARSARAVASRPKKYVDDDDEDDDVDEIWDVEESEDDYGGND